MVRAVKSSRRTEAPASDVTSIVLRVEQVALLLLLGLIPLRAVLGETHTFEVARMFRNQPAPPTAEPATTFACIAVILATATFVAAARLWCGAASCRQTGAALGGLLLLVAGGVSVWLAGQKHLAVIGVLDFLALIVFFLTLRQLLRENWQVRLTLAVILGAATMVIAKCPYQRWVEWPATVEYYEQHRDELTGAGGEGEGGRATPGFLYDYERRLLSRAVTGYFSHPNVLGSYLVLVIMTGLAVAASRRRRRPPATLAAPLVISIGGVAMLFYSQSKGAVAALIAALIVWWIGHHLNGGGRSRRKAWLAAWVALLLVAVGLWGIMRFAPDSLGRSMLFRFMYWQAAGRMVEDQGVLGVGPGNFGRHFTRYKTVACPEDVDSPHSWVVQAATEWGILGLGGLVLVLAGVSRRWAMVDACWPQDGVGQTGPPASGESSIVYWAAGVVLVVLVGMVAVLQGAEPGFFWLTLSLAAFPLMLGLIAVAAEADAATLLPNDAMHALMPALCGGLLGFVLHAGVDLAMFVPGAATTFFALLAVVCAVRDGSPSVGAESTSVAAAPDVASGGVLRGTDRAGPRAGWPLVRGPGLAVAVAPVGVAAVAAVVMGLARPSREVGRLLAAARSQSQPSGWRTYVASSACRSYREAITQYPLDGTAAAELAEELLLRATDLNHVDEVGLLLAELQRRDPENSTARQLASEASFRRFALGGSVDDLQRAVDRMLQVVTNYPTSPTKRLLLAELLERQAEVSGRAELRRAAAEEIDTALRLDEQRIYVSPLHRFDESLQAELRKRVRQLRENDANARSDDSP